MPPTSRSRLVSLAAGTAATAGLGMIPLHRLPRAVRGGYVLLPAALTTGIMLRALYRRDDADAAGQEPARPAARGGLRLPTAQEAALSLTFGGLVAGLGAGSIRLDRGIEDLLRRRGVRAPRVWMGFASGALSLVFAVLEEKMPDPEEAEEREELEDAVLELLSDVDPMALSPGRADGTPADEYRPEALSIAEILRTDGAIAPARLDAVWEHFFDEPLTPGLGEERVAALAAALSALTSPSSAR